MVRAKFYVASVLSDDNNLATVRLHPVTSGSKENDEFYKWTPGGEIVLSTINESAAAQFVPGKQFYVDFTATDE